jgi:hypothetical protein
VIPVFEFLAFYCQVISTPPKNSSVLQGQDANFLCNVTGEQTGNGDDLTWRKVGEMHVNWNISFQILSLLQVTKDGSSIFIGTNDNVNDVNKYHVTEKYRLHVQNVVMADDAEYTCTLHPNTESAWLHVNGEHSYGNLRLK